MPLYPFRCDDCGHEFEELVLRATAKVDVNCPQCAGTHLTRGFGVPAKPLSAAELPAAGGCGVGPPCGATGCRRIPG